MNVKLMDLQISDILVNPDQPRSTFGKDSLQGLAESIKDNGLLYPITVEGPHDPTEEIPYEFYILIDGERRLRAARLLKHVTIKALVRDPVEITRDKRALLALVANLQRDDLSPLEEAQGFLRLKRDLGMSVAQIVRATGVSAPTIGFRLQLLEMEEEIQDLIDRGELQKDGRLLTALQTIEDSEKRVKLASSLAARGASISAGVEACQRLNQHIRKETIPEGEIPPVRIAAIKEGPMPLPEYDVFVAAGTVPEWSLVKKSAKSVCDSCALRSQASDTVCGECPLTQFIVDLTRKIK